MTDTGRDRLPPWIAARELRGCIHTYPGMTPGTNERGHDRTADRNDTDTDTDPKESTTNATVRTPPAALS
jgi:hypothetical protein